MLTLASTALRGKNVGVPIGTWDLLRRLSVPPLQREPTAVSHILPAFQRGSVRSCSENVPVFPSFQQYPIQTRFIGGRISGQFCSVAFLLNLKKA